jgi:hypothetical protein
MFEEHILRSKQGISAVTSRKVNTDLANEICGTRPIECSDFVAGHPLNNEIRYGGVSQLKVTGLIRGVADESYIRGRSFHNNGVPKCTIVENPDVAYL